MNLKKVLSFGFALVLCSSCTAASPPKAEAPRAPHPDSRSAPTISSLPEASSAAATSDQDQDTDEPEQIDDEPEEGTEAEQEGGSVRPHPLDGRSDADLEHALVHDRRSLGSMSIGQPNAGLLLNGVQATENAYFKPVSPSGAWGTQETLDYLTAALKKVHDVIPDSPALALGDISAQGGGRLSPHVSHQAGRDLDIGFFYVSDARWYRRGTAENLDLKRNWAFVRAIITETDVEMILLDHSIQELLRNYAESIGEDHDWLTSIFRGSGKLRPILRHAPGHATHFHVRFYNPIAQETARRLYPMLVRHELIPPVHDFVHYQAKKGDTLGKLAKHFGVGVDAIKHANQLKKNLVREHQVYLIPVKNAHPLPPPPRLTFPARRLPPEPTAAASVSVNSKVP